jgi:alpha-galactosidase
MSDKTPAASTLQGAIDGFQLPARINGWVAKCQEGGFDTALHVEVRQGDKVLARTEPTGPRVDVTKDAAIPAAFAMDCSGFADANALFDGTLAVVVVDATGQSRELSVYPPTRRKALEKIALAKLSTADAASASAVLEALSRNPLLAGAAGAALARGRRLLGEAVERATAPPRPATNTGPRIAFIGAGSTVFAKNLLGDILSEPDLATSRIVLYDIDAERLRVSAAVAGRIADALGNQARIEATTDLGRALDGADYAITMIQVGGYRPCTVTDFDLPRRFGLRQTIADTLGIGGIMRGLRTIPVLLEIVREMERRCPDVLHLNYANPMAMNCWALSRASAVRTVGLCHSVQNTAAELARDIGVPIEAIDYTAAGINHMAFYLSMTCDGQDLYPRIRQVIAEGRVPPANRVRYDVLSRLGYFVTESSEHFAEYVPWYIKRDRADLIEKFNVPLDEYPRRCESQIAGWDAMARELLDASQPLAVTRSNEYGARIIHAVETGQPEVIYGNVPNHGLIDNLPVGCCVEVPCLVDGNGVQPVRIGALPIQLAALMQTNVNVQALTVQAALTGRRDHVLHAAMLDPHTAAELDVDQIASLVDALLEAHRPWLPEALFAAGPAGGIGPSLGGRG